MTTHAALVHATHTHLDGLRGETAGHIRSAFRVAEAQARHPITRFVREYSAQLASVRDDDDTATVSRGWLRTQNRVGALQTSVALAAKHAAIQALQVVTAKQHTAQRDGKRAGLALIAAVTKRDPAALTAPPLPDDEIGYSVTGQPLSVYFDALAPQAYVGVAAVATDALAKGATPSLLQEVLEGVLLSSLGQAVRVGTTEVTEDFRGSILLSFQANSDLVTGWTWRANPGHCPFCGEMDGTKHGLDEDMESHPNCFPAGVLASGPRPIGSTARWYVGDMVEIETARGYVLPVTPNHPILTSHGWIAAGELVEGDNVISRLGGERPFTPIDPNDYQIPAPIEQVAVTFGGAGAVSSGPMPSAPEDFHGDGGGSQVHVVRSYGQLRRRLNAPRFQPFSHKQLCGRHAQLALLPSASAFHSFLDSAYTPLARLLGSGNHSAVLFGSAIYQMAGFDVATYGDTSRQQARTYSNAGHSISISERLLRFTRLIASNQLVNGYVSQTRAQNTASDKRASNIAFSDVEPSGDSLNRFAGEVSADCILKVRRYRFAGHVYNLQTNERWYITNNIISHNCWCIQEPIPADDLTQADYSSGVPSFNFA